MSHIIQVKNLSKEFKIAIQEPGFLNKIKSIFSPKYKILPAVNKISFEVKEGEKIAFLGPNGAGKSTTIKMLTGILYPSSGSISVMGINPSKDRKKLSYRIGAVFGQISRLRYHLTAYDTFLLFGTIFEIEKDKLKERISYLVKTFSIQDLVDKPVRKLSLGQRMKCEIVAGLIHSPKVLFLDEPTIGLDMIAKQTLRNTINTINQTEKTTIFLTSHDLQDIEHICDRVIVINHGIILFDGSIKELKKKYITIKRVKIQFEEKVDLSALKNIKITKQYENYLEFEIENKKELVQKTISEILAKYKVEDFSVQEPDIEEIIRQFY